MNSISVVLIALKRLWNNKLLTLCSIVGMTVAVALISSIPLYTDAANFKVLKDELSSLEKGRVRPPFAFMYRYIGAWHGAVGLESFEPVNQYLTDSVTGVIDLPLTKRTRYIKTDNFSLFPASEAAYIGIRQPLGWINVGFLDDLEAHITLIDGQLPRVASGDDEIVQVLVSQGLAEQTGLQPGERYTAFKQARMVTAADGKSLTELRAVQLQLEISGVWAATDETDPFWFYSPKALEATMFMPEESFRNRVAPAMDDEIYAAIWYLVFDGESVRTDDVPTLVGRIGYANAQISSLLANTTLDLSPLDALQKYRWTTFVMTIVLYVFSAPILLLVLYFIGLISGLVVARQRGEIAIFKSRGAGDLQVIGIYALEGIMIGAVGFAAGLFIGRWLAVIMGNTISFLAFGGREPLPVIITPRSLRMALLGVAIGLLASLGPAMRAARLTIVTYKRERARAMEKPLWQRAFLDFLLLIPSGYGYYVLKNRGTISFLEGQAGGDPFQDPLLFLVPALTIFAVSLLIIRVFPLVMEFLAWLSGQVVRSVSVVFAFRQLARVSSQYTGSLLLLVLTLSLATFTASMARTLDQSLHDMMYYRYGSDYQLFESGESPETTGGASGEVTTAADTQAEEVGGWVFVPVTEHMRVPGILDATRIGTYRADATVGKATARGRFYGIDRLDLPRVAFFRPDFAYNSLGTLMNRLALDNSALLVSPNFLTDHSYSVGDRVDLSVAIWGQRRTIPFIIADVIRYFPTYYPEQGEMEYLFVGNLEYVFEQMGGVFPYDVWIKTDGQLDPQWVRDELIKYDISVISMNGSREAIAKEQARPERTGVFGILSVGFVAAAILTVLGFLLHSLISFRRRYIEFGVLRAIGLSVGQMIGFLGVEQLLLILTGISAGTGLGILVSDLFIPFLQVSTAKYANIPPFVVLIAWNDIIKIYVVFGAMLLAAVAGMIWFLLHLRIFEAVKLGEAV